MLCKVKVCTRSIKVVTLIDQNKYMDLSKLIHVTPRCYIYFSLSAKANKNEVWLQSFYFCSWIQRTLFVEIPTLQVWTSVSCAAIHDRFQKLKVVVKTNLEQVLCHSHALRQHILLIVLLFSSLNSTRAGQYTLWSFCIPRFLKLEQLWHIFVTFICQGCRRFLTISNPRWDQPISDIFI